MSPNANVLRPPKMPHKPTIELAPTTLDRKPAWSWRVRASDGRVVGFGIHRDQARAVAHALERFPHAQVEEAWPT